MYLPRYMSKNVITLLTNDSRQKRFSSAAAKMSLDGCQHGTVVRLADITQQHDMSNEEHTVQDLHDILQSYYKVARKRFVDNICMQAVDYYLVTGPKTPMGLFSPNFVANLTKDQLEDIAGEEESLKSTRRHLSKKLKDLEEAKKILF